MSVFVVGLGFTTLMSFSLKYNNNIELSKSDNYRVTAYTKKDIYGKSKWVDLIITMNVFLDLLSSPVIKKNGMYMQTKAIERLIKSTLGLK